jgi:hypothetical protein
MSSLTPVEDSNLKMAPILMIRKITPEILHQWERACKEFFRVKNIPDEKKVESILSRLKDFCIADWTEANEARLKALKFTDFMEEL